MSIVPTTGREKVRPVPDDARRADDLIEQLADAAHAGRARAPFQPGEVVGIQRDRDRLLGSYVYTISSDTVFLSTVYPRRSVNAADIRPTAPAEQTQSTARPLPDLRRRQRRRDDVPGRRQPRARRSACTATLALVAVGSVGGRGAGRRARAARPAAARAVGHRGAAGARHSPAPGSVAVVLYVSNFAWIALNNVIAASACARVGAAWIGPAAGSQTAWAIALGLLATFVVWLGPRAVARADRIAVPSMVIVAVALTIACLRALGRAGVGAAGPR